MRATDHQELMLSPRSRVRANNSATLVFYIWLHITSASELPSGLRAQMWLTASPDNIGWVRDFFRNEKDNHGAPIYSKDKFWLFCDSTFLSLHEPTDPASDYEGKEMLDQDDNPIRIVDVPEYQNHLAEDANNRPWWSGELTNLNAYYFTEYGGNYCYEDELGITAATLPLIRGDNGQAVVPENGQVASVILCPYNFDVDNPKPSSYLAANQLLESGRNLADAIPRSATLLHEAFHGLRGDAFLAGDAEKCRYQSTTTS